MRHLTCGTSFFLLFVFLISSLHHQFITQLFSMALILECFSWCFVFSTLVLKLSFLHSHLSLPQADLESRPILWQSALISPSSLCFAQKIRTIINSTIGGSPEKTYQVHEAGAHAMQSTKLLNYKHTTKTG